MTSQDSPVSSEGPKHRIPSLDGIRALAIALVILCHFGNDTGHGDPYNLGSLGVRIFFVLSGFLITGLLLKEFDRTKSINLPRFYFRRTLRIFPPFYCYLGVMLMISAFGWSTLTFDDALPALTYTSNYWSKFQTAGFVTSHTWSLATEEQFYLIWPLAFILLGSRRSCFALLAIILCCPILRLFVYLRAGYPIAELYYVLHLNADHLATGCLLAFAEPFLRTSAGWSRVPSAVFAVLPAAILGANALVSHPSIHQTIVPTFLNLAIAACVFWAVTNSASIAGKVLNARPVVWIGVLSYSLYLWQQPFLHLHDRPVLLLSGSWRVIAHPTVSLTLMMLCACASYYLVERPSLRVRQRWENLLPSAASTSSVIPVGESVGT